MSSSANVVGEATVVNVVGRLPSSANLGSHQQQPQQLHLSSHHLVAQQSVAQLHVAQPGTAATMVASAGQLGGQSQVLQQMVAQTAGGGHQLVHMVVHHHTHGGNSQANGAQAMSGTLQIGGKSKVPPCVLTE